MADLSPLFQPPASSTPASASLPRPPRQPSLRYRLSRRTGGLQLLRERGREYYAAIGRAGGIATARKARPSTAMVRLETKLPPAVHAHLLQVSAAAGVSLSALAREYITAALAASPDARTGPGQRAGSGKRSR